jgi:hypothetical protein
VQIVLIGQPELRTMLAKPELEQLAQRVIARFHLDALSPAETQEYIAHRLEIAGLERSSPDRSQGFAAHHQLRAACRGASTCCATARCSALSPIRWPWSIGQRWRRRRPRYSARLCSAIGAPSTAAVLGWSLAAGRACSLRSRTWCNKMPCTAVAAKPATVTAATAAA